MYTVILKGNQEKSFLAAEVAVIAVVVKFEWALGIYKFYISR